MTAEPMKTRPNKITDRSARKLSSILAAFITWLLPALILFVATESSFAASGTWLATPVNGDWNFVGIEASNWTDNNGNFVVPNGSADTATFGFSNITDVFISENTEVNSIIFTAAAPNPSTASRPPPPNPTPSPPGRDLRLQLAAWASRTIRDRHRRLRRAFRDR